MPAMDVQRAGKRMIAPDDSRAKLLVPKKIDQTIRTETNAMKTQVVSKAPKLAIKTEEEEESHRVGRVNGAVRLSPTGVNVSPSRHARPSDSGSPEKKETLTATQEAKALKLHKQKER